MSVLLKYLVNFLYLFKLNGFGSSFGYLRTELFNKKQGKGFFEWHYSQKSQTFWLVLLRLFLGYTWFMEGIGKLNEGWLADNFIIPNAMLFQSLVVFAEIAVGVGLLTGTLTFLFAVIAIGLQIGFALTTGILPEAYWIGSGRICNALRSGQSLWR